MLCVRDIMTCEVITLTPEATIREAMEMLSTHHLSGAPVVSGDRVVGLISMTDILGFIIAPGPSEGDQSESNAEDWDDPEADTEVDDEMQAAALSDEVWEERTEGSEGRVNDATLEGDSLLDQHIVQEAMTQELFCVTPGASVRTAAT